MTTDSVSSASFVNASVNAQNPWLGLHSFTEELREFFYGRDDEADELHRRVNRKTLTVLFGQSGLGKSSLLRAGLFPRLRQSGFLPFTVRIVHTDEAPPPAAQIISAFAAAGTSASAILQAPAEEPGTSLWEYFHHIDFSLKSPDGKPLVPVIVFDQFEEVFTLGGESESLRQRGAALLTELADLVENRPPQELLARFEANPELVEQFQFDRADYRVLLSLREDFLANLEDVRARMPSLSENRMRLTRMNGEQALDAVTKPGRQIVSPAVSRQIVRFVSGAASTDDDRADVDLTQYDVDPAMLSLFCAELNNRRRAEGLVQITADLLAGSRETILQDYYERCLADAHPEVRRFIEDELLTDQGYRVDVPLERAQKTLTKKGAADDALDALVKLRLLRIEERLHVRRVELTHDVLSSVVRQSRDERQQREAALIAQAREEHIRGQLRKARRRLAATVIAAAAIIAIIGVGFYIYLDRWVWPHDAYYNTFTKRRGVAVGIGELSERNLAARTSSFKITSIGRGPDARVVAMEAVDGNGNLTASHGVGTILSTASESDAPTPSRECRWEYIYDNEGCIAYEKALDKYGKSVWSFVYSPRPRMDDSDECTILTAHGHFIGEDGFPRPQRSSSAEYVAIEYSPEGWEIKRSYYDRNGNPQPGLDHAYGMLREYDDQGRMTKTISIDEKGQPMIDSAGNTGLTYEDFDAFGNSRLSRSFGPEGEPRELNSGWTQQRDEYDENGNWTVARYLDANDKPIRHADGYASHVSTFDARGEVIKRVYLDEQGKITTIGSGCAGWTAKYDDRGNEIERQYLGPDEQPARITLGISLVKYEYDADGLVEMVSYNDTEGKPTLSTDAIAGWTSGYDNQRREVRRTYIDQGGKPTMLSTEGIAGWTAEYDSRGNRLKKTWLGMDGKPVLSKNGYATEEVRYDSFGNQTWVRYLDESGRPCMHRDGYVGYTAEFDGQGNRVKFEAFNKVQQPQIFDGIVGWASEHDELGHEKVRTFIDERGNPTRHAEGYVYWKAKYDPYGREVERRYFDSDAKPAKGLARTQIDYNHQGKQVRRANFDASDKPWARVDGFSRIDTEYDPAGRKQKEIHFYEARPHADGHTREVHTFNDLGQLAEIECQDADGVLMERASGYARAKFERDPRGLVARVTYYDADGKPTADNNGAAGWTAKYDERGNRTEERNLTLDGDPAPPDDKITALLMEYDKRGNLTKKTFLNAAGKRIPNQDGAAGWTSRYDERNNEIERRFFDVAEQPTQIKFGYWKWIATYNDLGKLVEQIYLDDSDKPAAPQDGFFRVRYEYDGGLEVKRTIFYLRPHQDGHSAESVDVDEYGQVVAKSFLDAAGRPMMTKKHIARATLERDSQGRITRQAFFDLDSQPTLSNEGVASGTFELDPDGNVLELQTFGTDGKPKRLKGTNYSRWTAEYDKNGKLLEKAYFDEQGNPAEHADGFTRIRYEYDSAGRERKRVLYFELKPHPDGYLALAINYDSSGDLTRRSMHFESDWEAKDGNDPAGSADRETDHPFAYAEERYEAGNKLIATSYHHRDGSLATGPKGYARHVLQYDDEGNARGSLFVDEWEQPIASEVRIDEIFPDSQAEKLELQANDVLLSFDEQPVTDVLNFNYRLSRKSEEGTTRLVIRRGEEELSVDVAAGTFGAALVDYFPEKSAVSD